ncbi:hypothetical protein [Rathayibacter rathayi]|uniref:hypothetical protein n=1 Tax=Rathayibacter rathayi TaxID=33887 RepID=UPI0011B08C03|nr:hypothetical protein [Rathayibacter rathayi]
MHDPKGTAGGECDDFSEVGEEMIDDALAQKRAQTAGQDVLVGAHRLATSIDNTDVAVYEEHLGGMRGQS